MGEGTGEEKGSKREKEPRGGVQSHCPSPCLSFSPCRVSRVD